jgi:hypothetical protein
MSRVSATALRARIQAVAAVLLVHAAALLLIAVERSSSRDPSAPELQYVSLWPQAPSEPVTAERPTQQEASARNTLRPLRVRPERPAAVESDPSRPSDTAEPRAESVNPPVDWRAEVAGAAARIAQAGREKKGFSQSPKVPPRPCKPRVFDEDTKQLMEERLPEPEDPDIVGANPTANCIIVGGYPKCVQKITGKKRPRELFSDFVKDRRAGKKAGTSAPSLETCE